MARPRRSTEQKAQDYLRKEIKSRLAYLEIDQKTLAEHLNVSEGTVSLMLKDVDLIKPARMRQIVDCLQLDPLAVLRFCGYDEKTIAKLGREKS